MKKSKNVHPCYFWERHASENQIEIRDNIESQAKKLNIPPSIHEWNLINEGKLEYNWKL